MRRWFKPILAGAILACMLPAVCSAAGSSKPITVTPITAKALKSAIAAQKGHVVVVNFWATWCGPCVQEFPALVQLHQRYGKDGVVVMAVSADSPKDVAGKVLPFLRKQHAHFAQYLQHSKDPQEFIDAFDPNWYGDLPRTFVYDRSGRLAKELSGAQTVSAVAAAVQPLLKYQ